MRRLGLRGITAIVVVGSLRVLRPHGLVRLIVVAASGALAHASAACRS